MDYATQVEIAKVLGQGLVELKEQLALLRDKESDDIRRQLLVELHKQRVMGYKTAVARVLKDESAVKIFERVDQG